jgi:4-oxalocrotonate tautomerase
MAAVRPIRRARQRFHARFHACFHFPLSEAAVSISCLTWQLRAGHRAQRQQERTYMPLIEVHVIENVFDSAQKKQIIEKLTDAMVSVEGENMRGVTWVKISEVASGDWAIGGQPLTTEAVKALAAGKKAA